MIVDTLQTAIGVQMLLRCFAIFFDKVHGLMGFLADKRVGRGGVRNYGRRCFFAISRYGRVKVADLGPGYPFGDKRYEQAKDNGQYATEE